jgi:Flp pilus assembly protein TadB
MLLRQPSAPGILPDWAALTIVACVSIAIAAVWLWLLGGDEWALAFVAVAIVLGAAYCLSFTRQRW